MNIPVMIIPILNRPDLLEETLSTIDFPINEILIIDNGNNKLENIKNKFNNLNIKVLEMPSNLGCAGSWNLGIKLYPHAPYWFISSVDIHFKPGSLAETYPHMSKSNMTFLSGYSSFTIGEDFVRKVGLFDEYFYPAYYEDTDYHDRIIRANMQENLVFGHDDYPSCVEGCKSWRDGPHLTYGPGPLTSIRSNEHFSGNNSRTWQFNEDYWRQKASQENPVNLGWDLDRRRQNDWNN
jgi:GT2 family glycosyltransferase